MVRVGRVGREDRVGKVGGVGRVGREGRVGRVGGVWERAGCAGAGLARLRVTLLLQHCGHLVREDPRGERHRAEEERDSHVTRRDGCLAQPLACRAASRHGLHPFGRMPLHLHRPHLRGEFGRQSLLR